MAHEALIREWPTLHGWLEENREWLRLHRQLTEAAIEWRRADHAPDMLFRGARLTQLREWAEIHEDEMNTLEQEFLDASQAWTEKEAAERESQRQRELASVQTLADTQRHAARQLRRRAYFLVSALALTAITAVIAGIFASRNATLAGQNLIIARTAQAANMQSIASFKLSEAQRLAAEAEQFVAQQWRHEPDRSTQHPLIKDKLHTDG